MGKNTLFLPRRLVLFEDEVHEAVEAGVRTYSGQTAWTFPNVVLLAFSLASTTGEAQALSSVTWQSPSEEQLLKKKKKKKKKHHEQDKPNNPPETLKNNEGATKQKIF